MRGTITSPAGKGSAIEAIGAERDRARSFRSARRHSLLVKTMRLVLPAIAIVSLGLYGAALVVSSRLKSRDISLGQVSIDPSNLRMADPRYSGFSKDGAEYKVHAKSAVTDLRMSGPVRLDVIDGEITQSTGVVTRLKAAWGTYDQKKELLELFEKIDIDASNGMKARLTRATVLAKESQIISPEPVWAETEAGTIRASTMMLDTKARKAAFREAVEVTLRSAAKSGEAQKDALQQPARETQLFGLDAGSGEPVVVNARRLDVDDLAKTALFRESVVARQGPAELRAPELDVTYAGDASLGQVKGTDAKPGEATKLKSIKARGGVVMTSKESRAESRSMDYDAATTVVVLGGEVVMEQQPDRRITAGTALLDQLADTALLTGEVVVTQGRNILKGTRLAIDRKSATARLTSPAQAGVAQGRISTVLYQNNTTKPGGQTAKVSAAETGDQGLGLLGANFKSDPNAPIEVDAVSLDVNDRKHTALYAGAVVARQGEFIVRTEEMTAHYTGEMGLASGSAPVLPREKGKGHAPGGAEIRRIEARRNVVVTGKDGQQAMGEWANFDVKANNIIMGGNVTVTQGKQLVRAPAGMRLVIDLGTGVTRFEAEPGAAQSKSGPQVSGAFATSVDQTAASPATPGGCPPGAICKSGRLEAIFYPNQIKDKAKKQLEAATDKDALAADAAKEAARRLVRRSPAGSSWSTTNHTPGTP